MKNLKLVYNSPTEDNALFELEHLEEKWAKKYPLVIKQWKDNWSNLSTSFQFPDEQES